MNIIIRDYLENRLKKKILIKLYFYVNDWSEPCGEKRCKMFFHFLKFTI